MSRSPYGLYTSLTIAKQELNGGAIPMMPIPENVRHIINPDFVPGLGAFEEDPERGIRCPVCGVFKQMLKNHIHMVHADIGGLAVVCKALSVRADQPIITECTRQRLSIKRTEHMHRIRYTGPTRKRKRGKCRSGRKITMHHRNFTNSCEAQIGHRMWDLYHKLGRTPTQREAIALREASLVNACRTIYGSWNTALVTAGLTLRDVQRVRGSVSKEQVIAQLGEWFKAHGRLPTATEATHASRLPLIPHRDMVKMRMETKEWKVAMRRVARHLGVWDYRYRPEPAG